MAAASTDNNFDISLDALDDKTIGFGKVQEGKFNEVPYYRIPIFRTNSLGRQVPLIIHGPEDPDDDSPNTWLYSPGLKAFEDKDKKGKVTHSMMVLLHAKEGPTEYQKDWIRNFKEKVTKKCATFCVSNASKIGKPTLKTNGLKSESFGETFDHLRFPKKKDSDGKEGIEIDENASPSLSIKMIESMPKPEEGKEGRILNSFLKYDPVIADRLANGDPEAEFELYQPDELLNQRMKVKFELKVESIFVGRTTLSIQIKLYRALVFPIETKMRRIMKLGPRKKEEKKDEIEEEVTIPVGDTKEDDE
jgi:Protein of unknown function (DUF2738)